MKTKTIFDLRNVLSAVVLVFVMASCSEDEIKKPGVDPVVPGVDDPGSSVNHTVYAAFNESINHKWVAKFFGPCGQFALSDGVLDALATDIVVANWDVYVSGEAQTSKGQWYAKYWKNGMAVLLTDTTSSSFFSRATGIEVQGEDVYVSGEHFNGTRRVATYWKNGVAVEMGDGKLESYATDIFLSGNDVYVSGGVIVDPLKRTSEARYWKNGIEVKLAGTYASAISVVGSDVYVSGKFGETPHYYKNDKRISLKEGSIMATSDIMAGPNELYIAGPGMYWNSDTKVNLDGGSVYSLFALDKQVYTGGFVGVDGIYVARYWKNGVAFDITDGTNNAGVTSVFVVDNE